MPTASPTNPFGDMAIFTTIHHCTLCALSAKLRCHDCANSLNTWYCSKTCQSAHWPEHQIACKSARLYEKIRGLSLPDDAGKIEAAEDVINLDVDEVGREYLAKVHVDTRPETMDGECKLRGDVQEGIRTLVGVTTMESHKKQVGEWVHGSRDDDNEGEVPFAKRPITVDEDGSCGIRIFAVDYEVLSLKVFEECFANGKVTMLDPWIKRGGSEDGHATEKRSRLDDRAGAADTQ